MERQKIVLVAPKEMPPGYEELPKQKDEINAIVKWHEVNVVTNVDVTTLLETCTAFETPNIYHFSGHMTEEGFVANERVIPFSTIIITIQTARPQLVVLPICTSRDVAKRISALTSADCIYTTEPIFDERSVAFSLAFYQVLRKRNVTSYRQAFDMVNPIDGELFYEDGKRDEVNEEENERICSEKRMQQLETQVQKLNETVGELVNTVNELKLTQKMQAQFYEQQQSMTREIISELRRQVEASMTGNSVLMRIAENPESSKVAASVDSMEKAMQRAMLILGVIMTVALLIAYILFR